MNWLTEKTMPIFIRLMDTPEWQTLIQAKRDIAEQSIKKANEKRGNLPNEDLLQEFKRACSIFREQIQKNMVKKDKDKSEGKK